MKKQLRIQPVAAWLIGALGLAAIGTAMVWQVFRNFEVLVLGIEDHEALLEALAQESVKLLCGSSLAMAGAGIILVLTLHLFRHTNRVEKEAQALLRRSEALEKLAHHQRLETMGTLTSSIAHEFNNLLAPIMAYSMMALERLEPEDDELYDQILEIYNASRKAKIIISRLSDLSRKNTATTFHSVSPDELVRKTLDVAEPAKPDSIDIKVNLNCWDQRIRANEIQIQQMLLNLILNSFHAMGESPGTLTVDTSFDEKVIYIRVSDTGCGIPDHLKEKIFEPFFTTRESGKGTGLGLAIVAQVVADHQGSVRVDSQEGKGSAFVITLPRNPDLPERAES